MSIETIVARTLRSSAVLTGVGLHSGTSTTVRICPAPAGTGIVFIRTDLPGRPRASAQDFEGESAPFRTVVKKGAAEVHTVEHVLSALVGLGISDCQIEIDGLEVPGLDGSARDFVAAIQQAGVQPLDGSAVVPVVVREAVRVEEGAARIEALPHSGLKVTYRLDYPGHPLAQGSYEVELSAEVYAKEIAPARTFVLRKDAEAMRAAGLGKGADYQNTVVIEGDRALETTLRFDNEPVRHKILDLLGDLCLLGRSLQAHVMACCSGHRLNRALVMKLRETQAAAPGGKGNEAMVLDVNAIKAILPHRYPFLLVDRIVELEPGKRVVGLKNVSANESFFEGHFPGEPVMPGVLILEALAQVSCVLVLRDLGVQGSIALFTGADGVSWRRRVVPGDQLRLEAEVEKLRAPFGRMKAKATVDGELACEAVIKFMIQMPAEKQ